MWTDAAMPQTVGDVFTVNVYAVGIEGCSNKSWYARVQVLRCSMEADDFIYKYVGPLYDYCSNAFCGMN